MKFKTKYEPSLSDILWTIKHLEPFETGQRWITDDYALLIDKEHRLLKLIKGAESKSEKENLGRLIKCLKNSAWKVVKGSPKEIKELEDYKADWCQMDASTGQMFFGTNE